MSGRKVVGVTRAKLNSPPTVVDALYSTDDAFGWVGSKVKVWYSIAGVSECRVGNVVRVRVDDNHPSIELVDPKRVRELGATHPVFVQMIGKTDPVPAGHVRKEMGKGSFALYNLVRVDGKEIGDSEAMGIYIPIRRILKIEVQEVKMRAQQ